MNSRHEMHIYVSRMQCLGHRKIECQPCALTLMPAHPYFSASAGRIIRSHKHHYDNEPGVMGLKCPFSTSVTRRCTAELAKEYGNFCLEYNEEGRLALKEASPYYIFNDY